MTHTYYRCQGCGGDAYLEKVIRKHVQSCPKSDGRYVVVREEVKQVERTLCESSVEEKE